MMFHGGIKMKKYIVVGFIAIAMTCFINHEISAQGVWKNYTNANCINDIAIEGDYIWCATTGGVVRWDRRDGSYVKYTSADGLSHNAVNCVTIGPDDVKWFGTGYGVSRFDDRTWTTSVLVEDDGGGSRSRNWIFSMAVSKTGDIWASSQSSYGIWRFTGDSWDHEIDFLHNYGLSIRGEVMVDNNGTLWFNCNDGCYCYDGNVQGLFSRRPLILIDDDNEKWFQGGDTIMTDDTIMTYDDVEWSQFPAAWPVNTHIRCAAKGSESLKWFATRDVMFKFDGENWTTYDADAGLPDCEINAMAIDADNVLWIASGTGLVRFDGVTWDTWLTGDSLVNNDIGAVAVDHNNVKWFASATQYDVITYDNAEWRIPEEKPQTMKGIAVDNHNTVWIDELKYENYFLVGRYFNPHSAITSIAVDGDNIIWSGTEENGVYRYYDSSAENVTMVDGLASNAVYAVAVDSDNVKWFAVAGAISRYDGASWTTYPERYAQAVAVDHDNVKWFGGQTIESYDNESWMEYTHEAVGPAGTACHFNCSGSQQREVVRDGGSWSITVRWYDMELLYRSRWSRIESGQRYCDRSG